jgi:hypothetical protein
MFSFIHLDPFHLGLCINMDEIHRIGNRETFASTVHATAEGKDSEVIKTLRSDSGSDKLDGVLAASLVWHERRHFSDLLLTCFGSYKTRLCFQQMINTPALINAAKDAGRLVIPITAYSDDVRLEVLGLESPGPPPLRNAALHFVRRMEFLKQDSFSIEDRVIGSEAFYEALAFASQIAGVEYYFGKEAVVEVQRRMHAIGGVGRIYQWASYVGRKIGLTRIYNVVGDIELVQIQFLAPLLFAALCGTAPKISSQQDEQRSTLPMDRIGRLFNYITQTNKSFGKMTESEIWEWIESVAEKVWGITCLDSILADNERDFEVLDVFRKSIDQANPILLAFDDYANLRMRMIGAFRRDPLRFISVYRFPYDLMPYLHPQPTIIDPRGVFGDVPDGWCPVIQGGMPNISESPFGRWWWSASRCSADDLCADDYYLRQRAAWIELQKIYGPLAKFVFQGRAAPDCIGPEIMWAEQTIRHCGLEPILEPEVEYPPELDHKARYRWYVGNRPAFCDLTDVPIDISNSVFLSPWITRMNPHIQDYLHQKCGASSGVGYALLMKDWSTFLVHRDCLKEFMV